MMAEKMVELMAERKVLTMVEQKVWRTAVRTAAMMAVKRVLKTVDWKVEN